MGKDKAKDDKYVNFSEPYELGYIVTLYNDLTVDELRGMEEEIKAYFGKESNQHVTHDEVYKYLDDTGFTRES